MRFYNREACPLSPPLSRAWAFVAFFLTVGVSAYAFGPMSQSVAFAPGRANAAPAAVLQMRQGTAVRRPDLQVTWNERRAVPAVVKGSDILQEGTAAQPQGAKGATPDFQQKAVTVMGALAGLYGIEDAAAEFAVRPAEATASGFRHVRMNQIYRGLPVFGGQVVVHFDAKGLARVVNGQYLPVAGVATTPTLAAVEATAVAVADQATLGNPAGKVTEAPALVIYALDTTPTLAYQLMISYRNGRGVAGRWRYWVNALTGDVLLRYNDVESIAAPANGVGATISGSILTNENGLVYSVSGWRENTGIYYLWSFSNTWFIYDASINDYAFRNSNNWGVSDRTEMSAARNVEATADYYRQVHGRNSIDNAGLMARANVHNTGMVNAFWDGSELLLFDELPCALDVCGHEFTHGVTQYSAALIYSYESGALNESFSDIFGTLIEFYRQPDGRAYYPGSMPGTADWLMGEDTAPDVGVIRDMRNPQRLGQPSRYKGTNWYVGSGDNGGVHQNNGVQNFFFYLLCEGGTGTNDGIAYSVPGIGIWAGGQVAYPALTEYAVPSTDYTSDRDVWIAAAQETDSAGVTTGAVVSVMAAWAAVGIGLANGPIVVPERVDVYEGSTTNVTVTLAQQPASDVALSIARSSGSASLYLVGPSNLTFTTTNWNVPQIVTVGSINDPDITNDVATFSITSLNTNVGNGTFTVVQLDLGDTIPPHCVITGSVNADRSIISFDFVFDEQVTGFTGSDLVVVSNNIPGGITFKDFADVTGVGQHFRARYDSAGVMGAMYLLVPSNSLTDVSGNLNPNPDYQAIYTLPWTRVDFTDNFDGAVTTWTHSTNVYSDLTMNGWIWGPPVFDPILWAGPTTAYSGANCWGTMAGPYDRPLDAWLQSPSIGVGVNPVLVFQLWLANGTGDVEVNSGSSGWRSAAPGGVLAVTGGAWVEQRLVLDNTIYGSRSIQIRFRAVDSAMYVDDVHVESQLGPAVWLASGLPNHGATGTTVQVAFQVYNGTTSTLANVSGEVTCADAGVTIGGSTVAYGTLEPGSLAAGAATVPVTLAAQNIGAAVIQLQHQSMVGGVVSATDVLPFTVDGAIVPVATNLLTVSASGGVINWLGQRLPGNGSITSCVFQVLYAGTNGVPEPPTAAGQATGDDRILYASDTQQPWGRFGDGAGVAANLGKFVKTFAHSLPSNAVVYVRAWDAASYETSVAYGDSAPRVLQTPAAQSIDFVSWVVNKPSNYSRDSNGDSIPDGWCVLHGMDPRLPVQALPTAVTAATAVTDVQNPNRVAVSSNFVFIADTGNNRVQVWDRMLTNRFSIFGSTTPTEFSAPSGIAVSRDGSRVAVADTLNDRIRLFSVTPGTGVLVPLVAFGSFGTDSNQFNAPMAVAFDATGNIYVADSKASGLGNNRVQVFTPGGAYLQTFGVGGSGAGQFGRLLGISIGTSGTVFTADSPSSTADSAHNRVMAFGNAALMWSYGTGGSGPGQFNWVWDIQSGIGGLLYATDLHNNRVQMLRSTGDTPVFMGAITNAGPLGAFNLPRSAAPAPDEDVLYVADTYNNRVLRLKITLDTDGNGIDDAWELYHFGTIGVDPNADPDHDGVSNIGEYRLGTDPLNPDSNGNGVYDGAELAAGTDPTLLGGPVTPRIDGLRLVPSVLRWLTGSGDVSRVQWSTNLLSTNWFDTLTVTSQWRGLISITNAFPATNRVEFLRVKKIAP